jgi:hypothetical protein
LNGGVEDIEKQMREEEEVGSENLFGGLHVCCSECQVGAHSSRSRNETGWKQSVASPLWPSVGVKPNTSKVGDLESSGTPECLGFDSKAQNTSH